MLAEDRCEHAQVPFKLGVNLIKQERTSSFFCITRFHELLQTVQSFLKILNYLQKCTNIPDWLPLPFAVQNALDQDSVFTIPCGAVVVDCWLQVKSWRTLQFFFWASLLAFMARDSTPCLTLQQLRSEGRQLALAFWDVPRAEKSSLISSMFAASDAEMILAVLCSAESVRSLKRRRTVSLSFAPKLNNTRKSPWISSTSPVTDSRLIRSFTSLWGAGVCWPVIFIYSALWCWRVVAKFYVNQANRKWRCCVRLVKGNAQTLCV